MARIKNEVIVNDNNAISISGNFTETLKNELSTLLFSNDFSLTEETDENGKVLLFREFSLINGAKTDKGESHSVKVSGKFLAPCVRTQELLQAGKRAGFALALQLLSFDNDKVYEALGFKTTANMCYAMFGIDKATTNNYIAVARKMGKMHRVNEFPIGHLVRLLTAFREKDNVCKNPLECLNNAIDEMIVTPYMSQSELAEKAKLLATKGSFVVDTKTQEVNTSEANQGEANKGEANQGEANQGEANQGEANKGEANQGEANQGEANQGNVDVKVLATNVYRAITLIVSEVQPEDEVLKAIETVNQYLKSIME
jgi:Pentapeptide repeats (8 copies).